MSKIYRRWNKLWFRVKEGGKWKSKPTPFSVGDEDRAERYARHAQAVIDRREALPQPAAPRTVRAYAERWIDERRKLDHDWQNDRGRLKNHVLPIIGDIDMDDIRPRHIADMIKRIRDDGKIGQRTLYNVYGVVSAMFRDAVLDVDLAGAVEQSPCILDERHLGPREDKDPEWREHAVFTRAEVEMLISDERIPQDRRTFYAIECLAGLRLGETAALRWRHYQPEIQPLGKLLVAHSYSSRKDRVKGTKTGAVKHVPVHPTLAAILAEWRLGGWERLVGRHPEDDDLIVPLPPEVAARRKTRAGDPHRNDDYVGKRWREDLPALELRHRRGHDMRATFITLALEDGADETVIRTRITHTSKSRSAFDGYNRGRQWAIVCAEVQKLRISRRSVGPVFQLATGLATGGGIDAE
ncbi:MAG TPA: site-specific integrase [Kofleriaceae bacterium]|nr:site-specific integrase [Kofleriaceae bacterium]